MYKTLCVAALMVATFALTSVRSANATGASLPSPVIVARGKLVNQTASIPSTTIFTPTQTGLYRLSVYGTITTTNPSSQSGWLINLFWTDDTNTSQSAPAVLTGVGATPGQFLFGYPSGFASNLGGFVTAFEAKANTTVSYSVTQSGSPDNSAYSLYYTLERLE